MQQWASMIPLIVILALFYLIIFIPENRRKKKYNQMLNDLKVNDAIMTKGGIIGKIINIKDDYIILESGPDRARIKLSKNGISTVLTNNGSEEVESK